MLKKCENCGKDFSPRAYQIKIGTGKYCSHRCTGLSQKKVELKDRFWKMVSIGESNDCWLFTGFKNCDGYGKVGIGTKKTDSAHRISYMLSFGEIPKGFCVLHKCDNPPCCNPKHLFLGTQGDNVSDMIAKGRLVNLKGELSGASKLTQVQVDLIRSEYTGKRGQKISLSKKYGVMPTTITNILTGKNWNNN